MAELCDICVLPLLRMEEGGSRCNHCWEVTSRLKTFLGSPAARELVAATLAEIGSPPPCAVCRDVAHALGLEQDIADGRDFIEAAREVRQTKDDALDEIGRWSNGCPACSAAAGVAKAARSWRYAPGGCGAEEGAVAMFKAAMDEYEQAQHTPDCPNQARR